LLTDVVMPGGMTGYELAERLRRDRPGTRVLFTSGYTELARAADQPAPKDPLLSKPYRKQELGRAIRSALDAPEGKVAGY
jgi:CheY-like chemotaxis protein